MMSELFEKSIRTLELPAVLEMLSAKAVSEAAREKSRHIMPATMPPRSGWDCTAPPAFLG